MIGRTRSRSEETSPGADDDPYALYLRWVEAGRPPLEEAEPAGRPGFAGDPDDLAMDDEAVDDPATAAPRRAATTPTATATPSAGHVNATGAAAAITPPRRAFWPFRRR
ncbi:hypothetical protein ACFVAJ_08905 [Agromyces sp. NPDC057679]|uniref:hypothetical protein n=1 Tax=Agromyces sp. NPDC057679 TaxID=3346207 RepID=UPI00366B8470